MHAEDARYQELVDLPEPSEVESRMMQGAATFDAAAWGLLDAAFELYKTSYEMLFHRRDEYESLIDCFRSIPGPELMRAIEHTQRKIEIAFREVSENFRYLAGEFYAGQAGCAVVEGPSVSALVSMIEAGNENISAIERLWARRAQPVDTDGYCAGFAVRGEAPIPRRHARCSRGSAVHSFRFVTSRACSRG